MEKKYVPPDWAVGLNYVPSSYIKACKMEFLLAEAVKENCDCVVTCGGLQSNFCQTVVVACRELGLECHLLLHCPGDKAHDLVDEELKLVSLADKVKSRDKINITDRYIGESYGTYTDQDPEQVISIAATTGIILDLTYTNKAIKGLLTELQVNPSRFKGKRILYIHTGGIFGLYDQRIDKAIKQHELTNRITSFTEM